MKNETRKKLYITYYDSFGLNGDNPEGTMIEVNIIAGSMEKAIKKLRSSLPKSLEYIITSIEESDAAVII